MTNEEMAIMNLLRANPESYTARREIARKALKRKVFEEDPHWADAPLEVLVAMRLLEQDDSGHYRVKRFEG